MRKKGTKKLINSIVKPIDYRFTQKLKFICKMLNWLQYKI